MRATRIMLCCVLLLASTAAIAQTTASLTGTATSQGKGLPGVTVTISSPNLQGTRTTVTGENGGYQFSALPPGEYKVQFELSGLQTVTRKASLQLSQTARADADLKVAGVTEAITVTASAPAVLETPQVASTFTSKQIEELPVARTPLAAALLSPGVNSNTLSAAQFSISGSPGYDNLVMVNGVVVTENVRSQVQSLFVEDAVQETTVLSGAISAEYGRFTGGVVNTITKSGGNELSGSLRDTVSNASWTTVTPFRNAVTGVPQAKPTDHTDNVYEETAGGYFLRDRLWFFAAGRQAKTNVNSSSTGEASTTVPAHNLNPFTFSDSHDQSRLETKLTGMLTSKQTLVGSYLKVKETENNNFFPPIYDQASLVNRELPNALTSFHYDNILTTNFLVEGQYSRRTFAFINSGSQFTDLVKGTLLLDRSFGNTRFNSPTFCGVCAPETRDNGEYLVKGSYYLNTASLGNHNVIAGLDNFHEKRFAENHQSGSDYRIFATTAWFNPSSVIFPNFEPARTFIRWTPILVAGSNDKLATKSGFVNDKWDLNSRWSFNVGVRYDRNDATDANGETASKDAAFSPRLTAIYDLRGDGRQRVTASFNRYGSRIVEGIATANQSAGSPGAIDFIYGGPVINPAADPFHTSAADAITQLFAWFNAQCDANNKCGPNNLSLLRPGGARSVPGFSAVFPNRLTSPNVDEVALGYGTQVGPTAFIKVDLIHRAWHDFYGQTTTTATPKVTSSLGIPVDLAVVGNTNDMKRTYNGLQFQGQWHPRKTNLGMNYTYSRLRGNDEGETGGSGPVVNLPLATYYQRLPVGYLSADQRHALRMWGGYDFKLGAFGSLNTTVLESYDSGRPYAAAASIDLLNYAGAPKIPAYVGGGPATGTYYINGRDGFRFAGATHTDLALNYSYPIGHVNLFAEGRVINGFNQHAISGSPTGGGIDTSVLAAGNNANFAAVNPFTTTPVACPPSSTLAQCKAAGANYQLSPTFGKPTSFTAYQQARTYYFSVGARY